MSKLVAAVVLAAAIASPAFAQSYDPSVGSGNLNSAPYQSDQPPQSSNPYHALAQTPRLAKTHRAHRQTSPVGKGYRSPYAQYDTEGKLIDENMPGRW
jgi:hypothetical protein